MGAVTPHSDYASPIGLTSRTTNTDVSALTSGVSSPVEGYIPSSAQVLQHVVVDRDKFWVVDLGHPCAYLRCCVYFFFLSDLPRSKILWILSGIFKPEKQANTKF